MFWSSGCAGQACAWKPPIRGRSPVQRCKIHLYPVRSPMTPSATAAELKSCPLYINGKAVISTGPKDIQHNPATGEAVAEIPRCTAEEISAAIDAAQKAFPAWSKTPVVQRCKVLFKFRELLEANAQELVGLITEENGKTREEAQGSFDRGIECIEFACGAPTLMMGK